MRNQHPEDIESQDTGDFRMAAFPESMILEKIGEKIPAVGTAQSWKDFVSDQEVRWCPGCGDYAILRQIQLIMPEIGVPRENIVFVSGIGCAARFPYYMNTYGFHTIHGRALTVATGLKTTRPELSVWVVSGDGDSLAIGGNHFIHTMRRNPDINFLLFNNRVYGLTKGQYSPTSERSKVTKSSPFGTIETPVNPISLAVSAGATFIGRSYDIDAKHLQNVLRRAAEHRGTSFVEIYQNCVVYNDGAFDAFTNKQARQEHTLYLEHGKPMIFGGAGEKGIRLSGLMPEAVLLGNGVEKTDLLVHNEREQNGTLAFILSKMAHPELPVPVGIFRDVGAPTYEDAVQNQIDEAIRKKGRGSLQALLEGGDTWMVS